MRLRPLRCDPDALKVVLGTEPFVALLHISHAALMSNEPTRRDLLAGASSLSALALTPALPLLDDSWFRISLAQWSLHRALRGGKLDNLDFAKVTRERFGLAAVEYVNAFFKDKACDFDYLGEMKKRAADNGVESLLIMVDGEGQLGDTNADARKRAIHNHYRWVVAASFLGCHSIRVNAGGNGGRDEVQRLAADSLNKIAQFGEQYDCSVIVENHGGASSDGEWLAGVMKLADNSRVGTLPDFGNFNIGGGKMYDRYKGVTELMPYAKAVSAKSHEFDADGNETKTDYTRMMRIVQQAGYRGWVGIEWEGGKPDEFRGIELTRDLLVRCGGRAG
jgi:L-ribulose-5-phosphate 3-epimerase